MKHFSKSTSLRLILCALLLTVSLAACSPGTGQQPTQPAQNGDNLLIKENADVRGITVNLMESFPLQVSVTIEGVLPDGCTSIHGTQVARDLEKGTFDITIQTERPKDAMCIQVLTPFEITVPLDVLGLKAGTFTVNVYDQSATFTFEQDNVLQGS